MSPSLAPLPDGTGTGRIVPAEPSGAEIGAERSPNRPGGCPGRVPGKRGDATTTRREITRVCGSGALPMMMRTSTYTDKSTGPLGSYLDEIRVDALLSADDERQLAEAIARGDDDARAR